MCLLFLSFQWQSLNQYRCDFNVPLALLNNRVAISVSGPTSSFNVGPGLKVFYWPCFPACWLAYVLSIDNYLKISISLKVWRCNNWFSFDLIFIFVLFILKGLLVVWTVKITVTELIVMKRVPNIKDISLKWKYMNSSWCVIV